MGCLTYRREVRTTALAPRAGALAVGAAAAKRRAAAVMEDAARRSSAERARFRVALRTVPMRPAEEAGRTAAFPAVRRVDVALTRSGRVAPAEARTALILFV
jgi:hypothetical protein